MRKMVKFASLCLAATLSMTTVLTAEPQNVKTVMAEGSEIDRRDGGTESFEGDADTLHYAYNADTKTLTLTGKFEGKDTYIQDDYYQESYNGGDVFELLDGYIDFENVKIDNIFADFSFDCDYVLFQTGTSSHMEQLYDETLVEVKDEHVNNTFEKISFGNNFISSTKNLKLLRNEFRSYNSTAGFKCIDISGWDTSNVNDMTGMFEGCANLTSIDVSGLNTSNVKYMISMFEGCSNLTDIDVSNFDTSKVTDISYIFKGCSDLTTIDISDFCFDSMVNTSAMVDQCKNLVTLDMGFTINPDSNMLYFCLYNWSIGLGNDKKLRTIKSPIMPEGSSCYNLNVYINSLAENYDSYTISGGIDETREYIYSSIDSGEVEEWEIFGLELYDQSCEYKIENIPHDWVVTGTATATCTEPGTFEGKCSVCGKEKKEENSEALGHIPGETVIENRVEPTYDKEGGYDEVVYCTRDDNGCGHSELSRKHVVLEKLKKPESTDDKKEDSKKDESSKLESPKTDDKTTPETPKKSETTSTSTTSKTTYPDGLNKINGEWVYCKNNAIDTSYTGLCKYSGSWWYVKNGKVDFSATTLCKYNGTWFYVSGGKVNFNYTGLCKYNGSWFYVKGGQVSFTTTLCKYNGTWWYVKNGQVDFNYTGLCKYNGSWWYVTGGKVNFATTLCKYNGTWWYIKNGKVDFSSTTLCKYGNAWYCVSGGKVAWNYTGLCKYGSAWYYVQKGVVNFKATTLTKYAGTWWYVKNGVLNTSTTLCKYGNKWYAVSGGKVAWGYSGYLPYDGRNYRIVLGSVQF